jgi:hypothetical protein
MLSRKRVCMDLAGSHIGEYHLLIYRNLNGVYSFFSLDYFLYSFLVDIDDVDVSAASLITDPEYLLFIFGVFSVHEGKGGLEH